MNSFDRLECCIGIFLFLCIWLLFFFLQRVIIGPFFSESAHHNLRNLFACIEMIILRVFLHLELKVKGELPRNLHNHSFILVANHQSPFDIAVILRLITNKKACFLVRKGLGRGIPFVSYASRKMDILLDEQNLMLTTRSLRLAAKKMQPSHYFVIFPEGRKNSKNYPQLLPFKYFGLKVLLKNAPPETFVLPMVICGTSQFFMSFRTGIHFGKTIYAKILPPISINMENIDSVCRQCEDEIKREYSKLAGINLSPEIP